jgi:phosphate transport system substrate-binding protein
MPMIRRPSPRALPLFLALACGVGATDCRQPARDGAPNQAGSGTITVDGSTAVMVVSRVVASNVHKTASDLKVNISTSGTASGFEKLCAGRVDVVGASRPINAAELKQCQANGVLIVEVPIAFDSVSVVVNPKNTFAECLTVSELKRMWEPAAQGRITKWNQIRSSFPDQPLTLAGFGRGSGTFDYFTFAIVGAEGRSRTDYAGSNGDTDLVQTVARDPSAIGYLGSAHYATFHESLKLVTIDGGHGCVAPSAETTADGTYQPLSRPIFIYTTTTALGRDEVRNFVRAHINPASAARIREVGYVPLSVAALLSINRHLESGATGSLFGGRGSVAGLTPDMFQDEERVKNALVR